MSTEEYITIQKAADLLHVSYAHIYTLEKRGKLRILRDPDLYGKHGPVRIPRADVDRLLARLKDETTL